MKLPLSMYDDAITMYEAKLDTHKYYAFPVVGGETGAVPAW